MLPVKLRSSTEYEPVKVQKIKCFNLQSLLLQTIQTKSGAFPNDIIIDIDDDLVFSDGVTKGVCIVKNGKTEESTKDGSLTICHLDW